MWPLPLPDEENESSITVLRQHCNVESDNDFILAVAWIMGAMRPKGPYPILAVSGEMGSGKSFFTEMIASIIDPCSGKRTSAPKDERDLIIMALHQHTMLFDNLSNVRRGMSDNFCRLSTGGAIVARKLHSDDAMTKLEAQRPVVINGISELSKIGDMADRSIPLQLKTLEGDGRMTEEDLHIALKADMPEILAALFTGVSSALRNWENVELETPPRMADFARWVEASAAGMGSAMKRIAPTMRKNGYNITSGKSGERFISIQPIP